MATLIQMRVSTNKNSHFARQTIVNLVAKGVGIAVDNEPVVYKLAELALQRYQIRHGLVVREGPQASAHVVDALGAQGHADLQHAGEVARCQRNVAPEAVQDCDDGDQRLWREHGLGLQLHQLRQDVPVGVGAPLLEVKRRRHRCACAVLHEHALHCERGFY